MSSPRSISDVLAKLTGVKEVKPGEWQADCPVPGHQTPEKHLSVTDVQDKCLVTCHPGKHNYTEICAALGYGSLSYSNNGSKPEGRRIVAVYSYLDATGKSFEVVRFEPKDFAQRQPDGKGGYVWSLKGIVPTLYHANELPQAISSGETIFIVEGEKDADNLWNFGVVATCNPMGAGKWQGSYSDTLRGADVIISPDKDEVGRKHATQVAQSLYGKARRIRVLELPGEGVKDASDWLAAGGDDVQLKNLVDALPDYRPPAEAGKPVLRRLADVKPETVSWLWFPYIPKGKLTIVEGDPSEGKSWATLAIATAVSLGRGLPGVDSLERGNTLILSSEDGLGDTIRPRLDQFQADVTRIFALDGLFTLDDTGFAYLEDNIKIIKPVFVVIDPIVAYLSGEVDINKANQVRQVTARLAKLAETYGTAIVAVRHLTKSGGPKAIYRGVGSIDFSAAARSVLLMGRDSDDPSKRGFVQTKCNLAAMGDPQGYELTKDGGFFWTTGCNLTSAKILTSESSGSQGDAKGLLEQMLTAAPMTAKDIYEELQSQGYSKSTIDRAKKSLGVVAYNISEPGKRGAGKWWWKLPENEGQKGD